MLVYIPLNFLCRTKLSVVTQHTTACCITQVVDITLMKLHSTNITSLGVVQQKHCGSTHTNFYYYKPKHNNFEVLLGSSRIPH
jgi:hypothetical protein